MQLQNNLVVKLTVSLLQLNPSRTSLDNGKRAERYMIGRQPKISDWSSLSVREAGETVKSAALGSCLTCVGQT